VSAVCAVGTYGDLPGTVRHVLESPEVDPYGRVLLFRNFGAPAFDWSPAVTGALDAWLADMSLKPADPAFPGAQAALAPAERRLVDGLIAGTPEALAHVPAMVVAGGEVLAALDVAPLAARVRVPVTLVHGAGDRVIPPAESVTLAARLPRAHLCVTRLLSHGDTRVGPRVVLEVPRLLFAFRAWFAALGAGRAATVAPG
jgi:pimeloyl-ACP methyl ester carboxylesterase